jgi:hypothetical protein
MPKIHLSVSRITTRNLGALCCAGLLFSAVGGGGRVEAEPANSSANRGAALSAPQNPDTAEEATRKLWSSGAIIYKNSKYGLRVKLPRSWKGYKVTIRRWGGGGTGANGEELVEQGPEIVIQHPKSTEDLPRQDIPIMVFTMHQWEQVEHGPLIVSAAPIGPGELARSCRYVFALPPRYNYADVEGIDEVNMILDSDAVQAF